MVQPRNIFEREILQDQIRRYQSITNRIFEFFPEDISDETNRELIYVIDQLGDEIFNRSELDQNLDRDLLKLIKRALVVSLVDNDNIDVISYFILTGKMRRPPRNTTCIII